MPSMNRQQRRYNKNPQRRKIPGVGAENLRGSRTPITIESAVRTGNFLDLTFNQPIILKGVPQYENDNDNTLPLSATVSDPANTIVRLVYTGATTGQNFIVPFEDPAIRNNAGGYVTQQTLTAPE